MPPNEDHNFAGLDKPYESPLPHPAPRPIGLGKGQFVVPDDFDAPLSDEILREFYEGEVFPADEVG